MKNPCCVESGSNCPNTSSCSMILRSSCSHRHSHKSLMVNEVQAQGDTHQKRSISSNKISNNEISNTDISNNNIELDSFWNSSVKQLALTSTGSVSILKENIYNSIELTQTQKSEQVAKNGQDSQLVRNLHFSQTSTPLHRLHLNDICNSEEFSQKATTIEEDYNLSKNSSTMSRTRRSQRSNLRAFSGSEEEGELFLENRTKLRRPRNYEAVARLNSASGSCISTSESNANSHNSLNHLTSTQCYSTSAFRTSGNASSFSNYCLKTPTGVYNQNQRAISSDLPPVDLSSVQYSRIDRFRWMLWRYVYLKIISSVNFDAWLLSRIHDKKYKAVLILFLPLLFYLFYSTLYRDMGILSRPFDLISSTILSFASFVYSLISSPFVHSQEILERGSFSCPDISFLPTISGIISYLSNLFVKTEESTTFVSQKNFKPPVSTHQSMQYKPNKEELRSLAVEVLDERFNALMNNFYLTKIQYENQRAKEETATKFREEISDLHMQFQSLSGLLKQLEKDIHKIEESSASAMSKSVENLSQGHNIHFKLLNEKMKTFEEKLESMGAIKKCCDEKIMAADFMASIEKHLVTAFKNVVEGDKRPNSPFYFFNEWLNSKLTDPTKFSEINSAFEKLKTQLKPEARQDKDSLKVIEGIVQHYVESLKTNLTYISTAGSSISDSLSVHDMRKIAKEAIMLYDADKTGLVDYALESAGGSVLGTRCSESYTEKNGKISIFGLPLWSDQNSPRTAIQPNVQPGECWAFKGSQGFLVIQLSYVIYPTGFTLEHIPVSLSPTGSIDSAPKDFSVWGLASESDNEGILLGKYTYDQNGDPLQYFPVQHLTTRPISFVELKIHSNQGNLEYTCLYRFRVHGTRVK